MATLGSLVVDFLTNRSEFVSDVGKMRSSLNTNGARMNATLIGIEKRWQGLQRAIGKNLQSMLDWRKGLMLVVGAAGVGALVKQSLAATVELRNMAAMAGTTAESFQELAHAAAQYGINNDAVTDGLKELLLRVDEFVKTGKGPAEEALGRLGLGVADLNTHLDDSSELFAIVSKALDGVESEAARIRIADELFGGTGGEQFVQMLKAGSEEIERFRAEARRLGIVLSNEVVAGADDAQDKLNTLSRVIKTKVISAVVLNADKIDMLATAFTNAIPKIAAFFRAMGLVDAPAGEKLRTLNEQINETASKLAILGGTGRASMRRAHGAEIDQLTQELKDLLRARREVEAEMRAEVVSAPATSPDKPRKAIQPLVFDDGGADKKSKHTFGNYLKTLEDNRKRYEAGLKSEAETIRTSTLTANEEHAESLERLNLLRERGFVSQETYTRAVANADAVLDEAVKKTNAWAGAFDQMGDASVSALERMITEGGKARDVMAGLLRDISRVVLRQSLSGIGGAVSSGLGSLFGGFRADGGPVSAGMSYVVGERGPEIFTPSASGAITPNGASGGTTTINIDARGAGAGVEQKIAAAMRDVLAQVPGIAVRANSQAIRRGGAYARQVAAA